VKEYLNQLAAELRQRLPEHTYKAVIRRARGQGSDKARGVLLADILAQRERSEELLIPTGDVAEAAR
jgi:hypothetical protein